MSKFSDKALDAALACKMRCSDVPEYKTVRQYLRGLLLTLWEEGEGFSGKRPFGNSGWDFDLYEALIKGKHLGGKLDADGYVDHYDKKQACELIPALIVRMCEPNKPPIPYRLTDKGRAMLEEGKK